MRLMKWWGADDYLVLLALIAVTVEFVSSITGGSFPDNEEIKANIK
jgi:hypothetical protein